MKKQIFQVQPVLSELDEWTKLAKSEELFFEPLEFFGVQGLSDSECLKGYEKMLKDTLLVKSLHGAFIDVNVASNDPLIADISKRRTEDSAKLAVRLGAARLVLHSSCFPFLRAGYLDVWSDRCAKYYSELAREYGLEIFLENSFDLDPEPLCVLMRKLDDERVKVCLDVGHANYSRTPLDEWLASLSDYISYIHLSDNDGRFDNHLPLGQGSVDLRTLDVWLNKQDRDMYFTFEVGGAANVRSSLKYLRNNKLLL